MGDKEKLILSETGTTGRWNNSYYPSVSGIGPRGTAEVHSRPMFKAGVVVLFLVLVSVPVAWYLHCYGLMRVRTSANNAMYRGKGYPDYQNDPTLMGDNFENDKKAVEVFRIWWLRTYSKNVDSLKDDPGIIQDSYDYKDSLEDVGIQVFDGRVGDELTIKNNNSTDIGGGLEGNVKTVTEDFENGKNGDGNEQCLADDNFRFDCHPESGVNKESCEARGCCWKSAQAQATTNQKKSRMSVPWCFYPKDYAGYVFTNVTRLPNGYDATIVRTVASYYPKDIKQLKMEVTFETGYRLRIKIYDPANPRYEVPYPAIRRSPPGATVGPTDYDVVLSQPCTIQIVRKSTGEKIFDTSVGAFIFADQFIQLSTLLPSKYLYGLGERKGHFLRDLNWQQFTMFNSDQAPRENTNLYGSHPFYLMTENGGTSHGVFLLNSNAMDVVVQPAPALTFRTIGGILDLYVFMGPSAGNVVSQYTELIGRPHMPPYWGLGFHLCRFEYASANRTREIWQRTRDAGIPFDVQWNDIDYMDKRRDFSYDKEKYHELPQLVKDIHDAGMHYIPIIDPGINNGDRPGTYPPFDDGVKQDIFIKDYQGNLFIGKVWSANGAVWPDFTHPNATQYWTQQLASYHSQVPFDGIWIDMNEPSNFYSGSAKGCPNSTYEDPPYVPGVNGGRLSHLTVCMTAKQHASIHYNLHNLFGFTETIATNFALKTIRGKRPFIISRSTFPGQGHYGGHWTGDISSTWEDMQMSISGILDYSLFGIPLVGADICGFNQNTTAKLCQRWMELGAFYPFSRNHNTDDTIDQDPVALGPGVVNASREALKLRYFLLPYLYTLFYRSHVYGETVARPLFFEFPEDKNTYGIDTQFLWGPGLMIMPALNENETTIHPYFPDGTWYLFKGSAPIRSTGQTYPIEAPPEIINVAFRGGNILAAQLVANTTEQSRKNKFSLVVALNDAGEAAGQLYWDDGDSLGTVENGKYNLLTFSAQDNTVTSSAETLGNDSESMVLGMAMILGVKQEPKQVLANNQPQLHIYYKEAENLMVLNMSQPMTSRITITWH